MQVTFDGNDVSASRWIALLNARYSIRVFGRASATIRSVEVFPEPAAADMATVPARARSVEDRLLLPGRFQRTHRSASSSISSQRERVPRYWAAVWRAFGQCVGVFGREAGGEGRDPATADVAAVDACCAGQVGEAAVELVERLRQADGGGVQFHYHPVDHRRVRRGFGVQGQVVDRPDRLGQSFARAR